MAVKWSWAFGPETGAQLNNEMGWSCDTFGYDVEPTQAHTYTYPGSPTTGPSARYSLRTDSNEWITIPNSAWSPEGWVAFPYLKTTAGTSYSARLISIYGNTEANSIWADFKVDDEIELWIDSVSQGSVSLSGMTNEWNYWALRYTMSGTTWGATLFLNGVEILSGSETGKAAETGGKISFSGPGSGDRVNYYGQIICYDSLSEPSASAPFQYVTRINPTDDIATSGIWTPSVGSDDYAVLSSSFDSSTHTVNTDASSGEFVTCRASIDIATQIGTSPGMISGITLHAWASGSGLNGKAALSNNGSLFEYGDVITPDINDPTYCFFTAPQQVQSVSPDDWDGADAPYMRYELTGS